MPNIPTYNAGVEGFQPSDRGSSAFRQEGYVAQRFGRQAAEMTREEGATIGRTVAGIGRMFGDWQKQAQAHTDAMAEIDAQKQITASEIAAYGGVNIAGAPKNPDGEPTTENPARGVGTSLPHEATAPTPGEFAATVSPIVEQHGSFLENFLGNLDGQGVSQKARDRIAMAASRSQGRLALHAHAVAAEVAFNHFMDSATKTVNMTRAAVGRGDVTLAAGMQQDDDTFGAIHLSGEFAAKDGQYLEKKHQEARQGLIWAAASLRAQKGDLKGADAIINDKQWDKDIGGAERQKMLSQLAKTQEQHIKDQNALAAAKEKQVRQEQDHVVSEVYQNSLLPPDKQNPQLTRANMVNMPAFRGDAKGLEQAQKTLDELHNHTTDPAASQRIENQINAGIINGTITTDDQILRYYKPGEANSLTPSAKGRMIGELHDALNNPAVRKFNGEVHDWLGRNQGRIDRVFGPGGYGAQRTELGQNMIWRWEADVKKRAQALAAKGEDPSILLDPNSPNSMVSDKALAPYRVTQSMASAWAARESTIDKQTTQRWQSIPESLKGIPGLLHNPETGQYYDPATKKVYGADGKEAPLIQPGQKPAVSIEPPNAGDEDALAAAVGGKVEALAPTPGYTPDVRDVDPRLLDAVTRGASLLPAGYRVTIDEGYDPHGHVPHSQHHIKGRGALDVQIWGPNGEKISNRGSDPTGMYHRLARAAFDIVRRKYPDLVGKFAWGGRFGTTETSGVPDLMHFDIGGDRGHFGPPLEQWASR